MSPRVDRDQEGRVRRVWISARTGAGAELLLQALAEFFHQEHVKHLVRLAPQDGRLRARLFEVGEVLSERVTEDGGWELEVVLTRRDLERLLQREITLRERLIA
jgi:GTP-binding protein HflX